MKKNTESTLQEVDHSRRRLFLFKKESSLEDKTKIIARIDPLSCLSYHQIVCYSCKDICKEHISFQGLFFPEILSSCIGCDRCIKICPQNAISLIEKNA